MGSTSYITDHNGGVVQFASYLPYGEALADEHTVTDTQPYKFSGKELDGETGLYYFGARYYHPKLALWYGVDALAEKYPSMGGYLYCAANPVKYVDPDGRDWYENELTGAVYYNNQMGINDAGKGAMTGGGWKHMGRNNMFSDGSFNNSDVSILFQNQNLGDISMTPIFDKSFVYGDAKTTRYSIAGMFEGVNAKEFMSRQGYDKLPTQYVEYSNLRTDKYPTSPGRSISITTGPKIQVNEKYGYFLKGAVASTANFGSIIGDGNPLLGVERVDRKVVTYYTNRWIKVFSAISSFVQSMAGEHDYSNLNKVYNSWNEYPKNNKLINDFKKRMK